jgi:hypothetical protein
MQAIPLRKGVRPTLSPNMRERCPFPVICELLGLPLADGQASSPGHRRLRT